MAEAGEKMKQGASAVAHPAGAARVSPTTRSTGRAPARRSFFSAAFAVVAAVFVLVVVAALLVYYLV